jgi:hypothetical protein
VSRTLLAALLAAGCGSTPTSLLLTVSNDVGAPVPDAVRLRVFDTPGLLHDFTAFASPPPSGDGRLGTVVISPRRGGDRTLRVQVQGLRQNTLVSEGTVEVELQARQQSKADVLLQAGRREDSDGDGVPDGIDNCPLLPNPTQQNSGSERGGDACTGGGPPASDGGAPPPIDAGRTPAVDAPAPAVDAPRAGRPRGAACGAGADCASGFCADGVCCESACTGGCRSCALRGMLGTCAPLPAGEVDPAGGCAKEAPESCGLDGACDGRGACRKHPAGTMCKPASCATMTERLLPSACDGSGVCVAGKSQTCAPFTCAADACKTSCAGPQDCAPLESCINGSCGKKPLGATCGMGAECASQSCQDGVCCDVADCSGPCRSCAAAGRLGSCTSFTAGADPRAPGCPTDAPATCGRTGKCDGMGACQRFYPAGTTCGMKTCTGSSELMAPACDGMGACRPGATRSCDAFLCKGDSCGTMCATDADCTATGYCKMALCHQRQANGAACTETRECQSGFCIDGVCCESACTEQCRRCEATTGRCVRLSGQDTNSTPPCVSPMRCIGSGSCM